MDIVKEFEESFARYVNAKHAISLSLGRNALYTLLKSLGIKEGDEIIVPSFICSSVPETIVSLNAKPVLVDVNQTFTIDESKIKENISERTKAIITVHTYGNPARIDTIKKMAQDEGVVLIEDVAHALGSKYKNKSVGSFGDYAIYSLTKNMINFGGGMITTNEDSLTQTIRKSLETLHREGKSIGGYLRKGYYSSYKFLSSLYESRGAPLSKDIIDMIAKLMNTLSDEEIVDSELLSYFKITKVEAAIAHRQLKNLEEQNEKRKTNAEYLRKLFLEGNFFEFQKILPGAEPIFLYFSVLLSKDMAERKGEIIKTINKRSGIRSENPWSPFYLRTKYRKKYGIASYPVTEDIVNRLVIFPMSPYYDEPKLIKMRDSFLETIKETT